MSNAMVPMPGLPAMTFQEMSSLGELFAKSGYFSDARSAAQAVVKIQAGRELGFPPMAAMSGVYVIDGKPSIGAHLMAAMIRRSGRYDYKVVRLDKEVCELEFFVLDGKKRESAGPTIKVTFQDFVENGLAVAKDGSVKSNWRRSPDDMLFARAVSKGYRRYCPDLSCGLPVYTTEELEPEEPKEVGTLQSVSPPAAADDRQTLHEALADQPITEAEKEELVELLRETGTDAHKLCAAYKIPVLAKLPHKHFAEVRGKLLARKQAAAQPAQQPAATPSPAAPVQDVNKLLALRKQVDQLLQQLQLPEEGFKQRLKEMFGTTNSEKLTVPQLEEVVSRLTKKLQGGQAAGAKS